MLNKALIAGCVVTLLLFTQIINTLVAGTVTCATAEQIQNALKSAKPGDEIVIEPGEYTGIKGAETSGHENAYFYSNISGAKDNHIIIRSLSPDNKAVLTGNDKDHSYGLYIVGGNYWDIKDLKITGCLQGIMLDKSSNSTISGCEVYDVGQEGIHLRDSSSNNKISECFIHDTGLKDKGYGEAICVGTAKQYWKKDDKDADPGHYKKECDNNWIFKCRLGPNVTAEHVDIKEGTKGTKVQLCNMNGTGISGENYANSFIDCKGNDSVITYNDCRRNQNSKILDAFTVSEQEKGWGQNNHFENNTVHLDTEWPYVIYCPSGSAFGKNNTRDPLPKEPLYRGNVDW